MNMTEKEYQQEFSTIERDINRLADVRDCEPVLPEWDEIQLDLDSDEAYELMKLQMGRFNDCQGEHFVQIRDEWRSRGGNRHVVLCTSVVLDDPTVRILLQCLFGSDVKRELFNLLRVWKELNNPICLFKPKARP